MCDGTVKNPVYRNAQKKILTNNDHKLVNSITGHSVVPLLFMTSGQHSRNLFDGKMFSYGQFSAFAGEFLKDAADRWSVKGLFLFIVFMWNNLNDLKLRPT